MKSENIIWNFFSSVKLALFTLCSLAATSILGTIIPQKEASEFYIAKYGAKTAHFFQLFEIPDMYNSWWFLTLLGLLSANLIICSIDRFPGVWKQIKADNLSLPLERISKMSINSSITSSQNVEDTVSNLTQLLSRYGWKAEYRDLPESQHLLFCQKGALSRTGVYIVHTSILVIFIGAIVGQILGFKGSIMLPEMQSSNIIYPYHNGAPIELGFEIRCDRFDIEFYSNGMPKEYRSDLTVLENGKEILHKPIEVNDPLQYRGITFYQSSYQGYRDFIVSISEDPGEAKTFSADFQKELIWKEKNLHFGIINLESIRDRVVKLKIWFNDGNGDPSEFWMDAGEQVKINRSDKTYLFSAKQRYATGLQVARDPGVWLVYLGCGLMLLGLYMAFFMSHRRIWLLVNKQEKGTSVLISGTANKNKTGFEGTFKDLAERLRESI